VSTPPLISWRGERARLPLPLRVLGRYFITGQELRGPGDNATFLHRATADYRGRPYTRLTGPLWQRLARRHLAYTVPILLACLKWQLALGYLAVLTVGLLTWAACRALRWKRERAQVREWVRPAAQVLSSLVGVKYTKRRAREMVRVPSSWPDGAAEIRIPAGTALSPRLKDQITRNLGARLGLKQTQADWRESGAGVCVFLKATALPPERVEFTSLLREFEKLDVTEWIAGVKPGGPMVVCSLAEDSPHILMSGAAGTGKSVLVRSLAVQRAMLHGDGLIITDPKRFSHWRWAGGGKLSTEQVIYAYRDADLHETWLAIGEEIARRIELPEEELARQRRIFVIVEEANVQAKKLIRYWRGLRKEIMTAAKLAQADGAPFDPADLDPPVQSPAIVAMQEMVCMGRELMMHGVVAAQRASTSIFGGNGGDIRESVQGGRFIARWDRKLWKMLVDTVDYVACPSGGRGLWGLARGDEFEIFRVPWLDEDMATALIQQAAVSTGPVLGVQRVANGHAVDTPDMPALDTVVTLAEAVAILPGQDGPDALSLEGLRTAARRSAGFPEPVAKPGGYGATEARLYNRQALLDWREHVLTQAV
jgi:hypothetical protein